MILFLVAIFVLFAVSTSFAQTSEGTLAGTITDSSGAVIPGAHIVAVGVDTGSKSETISTGAGDFRFPQLSIGRYNVAVTAPGFSKSTSTGVLIT
ncbi:MAG: carboxypeptidase-like regulatory domain-containing protein, partial [Acidobacteriaceae bacterium]